jgi:transposase-like protein
MSEQEDPTHERPYEFLLEALTDYPQDIPLAHTRTKKYFVTCAKKAPLCSGREVYKFSKSPDGHTITYQCTACGHRWSVSMGGSFHF